MKNKITLPIKGLHCRSCETLLQEKLINVPGVRNAHVSFKRANAVIETDQEVSDDLLEAAVNFAGYGVGHNNLPWLSRDKNDWLIFAGLAIFLTALIFIFKALGVKLDFFKFGAPENLLTVALIGLAAGFSTCMALTGGLLLVLSAKYSSRHPGADIYSKMLPQLMFNAGRLASYALLGGVIGLIGSAFQISPLFWALLTALAALVMLILGLQLVNIFPRFSKWSLSLPNFKFLKRAKSGDYSHFGALLLGALTFFLPCGFTQAMQLYAVSTGNFFSGLLVMLVFAIGTLPGLLIAGLLGTLVKGKWSKLFLAFIGVVVIFFALYNLINAGNLLGLGNINWYGQAKTAGSCAVGTQSADGLCPIGADSASAETQVIKADYTLARDIIPNEFTVKAGSPVSFEVNPEDDGSGCMSTIMIPGLYNHPVTLVKGVPIIMEFTPKQSGSYPITCAMGVKRGTLIVK